MFGSQGPGRPQQLVGLMTSTPAIVERNTANNFSFLFTSEEITMYKMIEEMHGLSDLVTS